MTDELIGRLRRKLRRDGACRTAVLPVERLHFSVEYRSMDEAGFIYFRGRAKRMAIAPAVFRLFHTGSV